MGFSSSGLSSSGFSSLLPVLIADRGVPRVASSSDTGDHVEDHIVVSAASVTSGSMGWALYDLSYMHALGLVPMGALLRFHGAVMSGCGVLKGSGRGHVSPARMLGSRFCGRFVGPTSRMSAVSAESCIRIDECVAFAASVGEGASMSASMERWSASMRAGTVCGVGAVVGGCSNGFGSMSKNASMSHAQADRRIAGCM
jgi:hypothetical protein